MVWEQKKKEEKKSQCKCRIGDCLKCGEEAADVAQGGGALGALAGPGVEEETEWTLGSNEFIQGGVGARGKSAVLFGQDFWKC